MSFKYAPSMFRIPEVPNLTPPAGFWYGVDKDAGYFAYKPGDYSWGSYIMTKGEFAYSLKIGNSTLKPVYSSINGYIYWEGNGYVYYTLTYGWVYMPSGVFPGYEPIEDYEWGKEEIIGTGDAFYTFNSFPSGEDDSVSMEGRGSNYDRDPLELKATWARWKSNNEFGKYEAAGDASGDKYLGLPRFRGNGEYFIRSFAKENGYYTYGRIHHSDGKWVIGEVGADSGWHEGDEPDKEGSVTFKFCKPEGSEAKGSNITVSLYDYVKGDQTNASYLGEVAIWR